MPKRGKFDDLVLAFSDLFNIEAQQHSVEQDVLPAGQLRMEAGAELQERRNPPVHFNRPLVWKKYAGDQAERGALARPVGTDEAESFAAVDVKRKAFKGNGTTPQISDALPKIKKECFNATCYVVIAWW